MCTRREDHMNKLTRRKILLTPARVTDSNIYSDGEFVNSCRDCINKLDCPYADLIPKYMPMCIRFSISKYLCAVDDDHLNLYVPLGMDMIYNKLIVEGEICTN